MIQTLVELMPDMQNARAFLPVTVLVFYNLETTFKAPKKSNMTKHVHLVC